MGCYLSSVRERFRFSWVLFKAESSANNCNRTRLQCFIQVTSQVASNTGRRVMHLSHSVVSVGWDFDGWSYGLANS